MKKTFIFAALVAAMVFLGQAYGERGTTFVLLLLAGALYIFAEMNSSITRAIPSGRNVTTGGKKVLEFEKVQREMSA